jgi:hypothetical protein
MANDVLKWATDRLQQEVGKSYSVRAGLEEDTRDVRKQFLADRLEHEPKTRNAIDEACGYWITNGRWPQMDAASALWVSDRLAEALLLSGFLHQFGFRVPAKSEDDVLKFLLIDCWVGHGLPRTKARLI